MLTNSYLYEFAGIEFFRASGFFHEPVTTWFMTIPAIVLITSGSLFSTNVRRLLITVQILFLFAAFSLSIMFSLVLIYIFRQMLYSVLDISTSFARLKPFLLVAMVGVGIWVIQYLAADYNYKGYWSGMNVVLSRLHSNNYLEIVFNNFFNPSTVLLYIYLLGVAISCAWKARLGQDNILMGFSLIVISFLIVALKGNFYHLLINPGFFIMFFIMLKHRKNMIVVFSRA